MTESELGHYVYAVGEAAALAGLADVAGIDDAPVNCAVVGRLCGLTSTVNVLAFRAAEQAHEVSETSWLASAVRAHESVALRALEHAPILPMRFGTVFPRRDDVETLLRQHQDSLLAELHRLADGTEWCVTVRVAGDAERAHREHDEEQQAAAALAAEPASGTAWLLSRQAALHARESHADRLAAELDRVREAVTPLVRDVVVSRPAGGATDTMRLWLLVDDVQPLGTAVDDLRTQQHDDVAVELTGPWPAYHFVRTDALHDSATAARDNTSRDNTAHDNTAHDNTAPHDSAEARR